MTLRVLAPLVSLSARVAGHLRPRGGRRERPRARIEPGVDRRRHQVPEGLSGREPGRGRCHRATFANAFSGAEDALAGFTTSGKLQFSDLADSVLADLTHMTVRQTFTAPLAGALQSAFAGSDLFACSTRRHRG
jgi:Lambda phage tail tape-measure protein (Tape_meas_lam_C)